MTNDRRQVAEWAERYLAGNLSFQRFLELVPEESEDSLVTELVDLVEHEPKRGGILGATPEQYDRHMRKLRGFLRRCGSHDLSSLANISMHPTGYARG